MGSDPNWLPKPANWFGSDPNARPNSANWFEFDPNQFAKKRVWFTSLAYSFTKKVNQFAGGANWLTFLGKQVGQEGYALAFSLLGVPWPAKRTFKSSKAAWAPGCLFFARNLMLV